MLVGVLLARGRAPHDGITTVARTYPPANLVVQEITLTSLRASIRGSGFKEGGFRRGRADLVFSACNKRVGLRSPRLHSFRGGRLLSRLLQAHDMPK